MTVSIEDFSKNHENYFEWADSVRVVIERGHNKYYLTSAENEDYYAFEHVNKNFGVVCPKCRTSYDLEDVLD